MIDTVVFGLMMSGAPEDEDGTDGYIVLGFPAVLQRRARHDFRSTPHLPLVPLVEIPSTPAPKDRQHRRPVHTVSASRGISPYELTPWSPICAGL
jgi:hypothetical protein